jgi:hypothetical protein
LIVREAPENLLALFFSCSSLQSRLLSIGPHVEGKIHSKESTKMKAERGQSAVLVGLLLIFVVGAVFVLLAGGLPGMKEGADTIADSITSGESYVMWKGTQTLYPNQHAIASHGQDAYDSVDCYNRNGAFHVMSNADGDFNLLCRDDDDLVRDVIVKRRGSSNIFDFINAYTPKGGNFARIKYWLENTWKCGKGTMPNEAVIVIDGVVP